MHYTGVGSRSTPKEICHRFNRLGLWLFQKGFILRSGGADGADSAIEKWVPNEFKEIYIPWKGFNNSTSNLYHIPEKAYSIASKIHPAWDKCSEAAKKLHSRNCMQVLGLDLKTPSKFLVCWTENGEEKGGTRTAIVLAKQYNIPIFNFGAHDNIDRELYEFVKTLL